MGKAAPQTKEIARKWNTTKVVDGLQSLSNFGRCLARPPSPERAGDAPAFPVFASKPRL